MALVLRNKKTGRRILLDEDIDYNEVVNTVEVGLGYGKVCLQIRGGKLKGKTVYCLVIRSLQNQYDLGSSTEGDPNLKYDTGDGDVLLIFKDVKAIDNFKRHLDILKTFFEKERKNERKRTERSY